jgi:hypothetical protein
MHQIDVHKLADNATFNRFHAKVLAWCLLIIIIDGYDIAVAGTALPSIMKEMGVTASTAGFMASSALFGAVRHDVRRDIPRHPLRQDRASPDDLHLRIPV